MKEMACLRIILAAAALLLLGAPSATALTIQYCSDENTASASTLQTSIYQSNGLCGQQCSADYAFAILQGNACWCSNYIPASQSNVSACDSSCPGYPPDLCGNPDKGLYGYIAMSNVLPSGTATGTTDATGTATASSSSSSSSEGTATETSTPLVETVTVTASDSTRSTFATSALASSSSSSSSSSSTSDPPTTTASPIISISAGQPVTITVSATPAPTSAASSASNKKSSLSGGAIAGIVIGSLVGVGAAVAFALWFFCFGRRRGDDGTEKPGSPTGGNGSITGGTIDTRRQSRGSQMSFMRNFMGPADHETTPTSPIDYLSPSQAFTDNRMKKNAVLYPNGDRQSAVSLRDDEDYSRPVLRLTNPD